ncbi:ferric reductase like transmembrane component [Leptodontidium sp. 2 PMI_412]|nr:ferric reductase like transmembrane component [Leptodontidium sp. 2 PMI_412]
MYIYPLGVFVLSDTIGRTRHGLVGYPITMYKPTCAFACRAAISSAQLNCSVVEGGSMEHMADMASMAEFSTPPECYATDDIFLQTLAWCVASRCVDLPVWRLEKYWSLNVAGIQPDQPRPKEPFEEALMKIPSPPTTVYNSSGMMLNSTQLVSDDDYNIQYSTLANFENGEITHERYGLVVLLSGFVLPIAISLLRFFPFPRSLRGHFNAYLNYPFIFGSSRFPTQLHGIISIPTRGRAFFIAFLVILNIIFSAISFTSVQPNTWYPDTSNEISTYVANRLGVLSFANIPLLILYSGRNNVLLWITGWSHSTFLLLHRWIAAICMLQAVLHSIIFLQIYVTSGGYNAESKFQYWYWGIIATLCMCFIFPLSIRTFRQHAYEVFLLIHISLSVLAIWGYETWIYTAIAVWGFDRVLRLLRITSNGVRTAHITIIDDDYLRIDIPGISAAGHAYLYFPTLTWRVWENHPFSVAGSNFASLDKHRQEEEHDSSEFPRSGSHSSTKEVSETPARPTTEQSASCLEHQFPSSKKVTSTTAFPDTSVHTTTFFLRTKSGTTPLIRQHTSLCVLVESSYGAGTYTPLSSCCTLVVLAGGIGITAALPLMRRFEGRVLLFWGVRGPRIVEQLEVGLHEMGVELHVSVGERVDVKTVLQAVEGDFAVFVSGPDGMADEARSVAAVLARQRDVVFLEEEFSW